ncbi:MAG: ABC transporter permease, partial [Undibacterium sp.]|nr:ABC transporter permease [Undibacterium sp.]
MLVHFFKPIWKRKFKNLMLTLEILLAFVVVFFLVLTCARYYQLYHLPTGFQYENVWAVDILKADGR